MNHSHWNNNGGNIHHCDNLTTFYVVWCNLSQPVERWKQGEKAARERSETGWKNSAKKMETQMDAHSVAVISRDGWERQRCGLVPASATTRREKQIRTKFGNVRKRGQEIGWFRGTERKQRGMKAEDKKGGRHMEEKQEWWYSLMIPLGKLK